jgi:hypothetical protein
MQLVAQAKTTFRSHTDQVRRAFEARARSARYNGLPPPLIRCTAKLSGSSSAR